ncbi:GNAT family N-acetyltransferase [Microbispora catharanthi]|uniref:GNAT family N-acetyltransferase n=1 Tax=Microbispora catharanthi TaxID=1712871 RepID=A0A5N6AW76_9ACTN|nr:GNAT family N-acetyltransferase [Microbispora catharanthi]
MLPASPVWVAELNGQVVGFACLQGDRLDHLSVTPAAQGRSIGTALLGQAKKARPRMLDLHVFQQNTGARRFYERHGFTLVEERDGSGNKKNPPDARYRWRSVGASAPPRTDHRQPRAMGPPLRRSPRRGIRPGDRGRHRQRTRRPRHPRLPHSPGLRPFPRRQSPVPRPHSAARGELLGLPPPQGFPSARRLPRTPARRRHARRRRLHHARPMSRRPEHGHRYARRWGSHVANRFETRL